MDDKENSLRVFILFIACSSCGLVKKNEVQSICEFITFSLWMDEGKKSLSWMSFFHGSSPLSVDDKKILANLFLGLLVDDRKFALPRILSSSFSLDDGKKSFAKMLEIQHQVLSE
jgi:hypothetical protein